MAVSAFNVRIVQALQDGTHNYVPVVPSGEVDTAWVQTRPLDLGSRWDKYIDAVVLDVEGAEESPALYLHLGWSARLSDPVTWLEPILLSQADEVVRVRFEGRYVKLKLEDRAVISRWKLNTIEFYGQAMRGRL